MTTSKQSFLQQLTQPWPLSEKMSKSVRKILLDMIFLNVCLLLVCLYSMNELG